MSDKSTTRMEELAKKWKLRLEAGQKNQKKIFDKAKEHYQTYYAITNEAQKAKSPWKSNVFLPLLPGKARDVKSKLSILEPRFIVKPVDSWKIDPETQELAFDDGALINALKVTKKLNKEYSNYTANGGLPPRASVDYSTTDAIVAGWGLMLAPLATYKKKYITHDPMLDAEGKPSAYVRMDSKNVKSILRVGTDLIPLDIFKCWISPRAKSWEQPIWTMYERDETFKSLTDANSNKGEKVYTLPKGLETAKGVPIKNEYSAVRNESLGYQVDGEDMKDDTVEVFGTYDCYDEELDTFYTFIVANIDGVAGDWHCIRELVNPYNHGLNTIIPVYTKRRPHSPFGESFFEISKDLQPAYNAAYNQFSDNSTLAGESMVLADKNSIIDGYEIGPGEEITYDSLNGEKPEPWKLNDPNPAVLNAKLTILEKNAEGGMVPQYTSGQVDSSMDKTAGTRGGIEMLMEAANDKLTEMLRNLKGSLLRYGFIALHNAQQYQNYIEVLDTPDMSAAGQRNIKDGVQVSADFITPIDLQNAFDIDIDDESMLPMTKAERRRMYLDFVNALVTFQKASIQQVDLFKTPEDLLRIDWADVSKELGNQFGELNAPAFIKKALTNKDLAAKSIEDAQTEQQATEQKAKIAQESNPGADVSQDPNGITVQRQKRELSNFKDYPADVKNAVLASFGYPESQLIDDQAKAQIAEAQSAVLDTQVKEQMIQAAKAGAIAPETLAKFVSK